MTAFPIEYPARYRDRSGEEQTTIVNDGHSLTMFLRGVRFEGNDFDCFEPSGPPGRDALSLFSFLNGSLCSCTIEGDIPILVVTSAGTVNSQLTFELELGEPLPTGQMDKEQLKLRLVVEARTYESTGKTGWFEGEMLDLQSQLPVGTFIKTCINCAFSDYSPYGHGLFGGLACFRENKQGYRAITNKYDLFKIWDTLTEFVQETYLCPDFERRAPGTGYRG